MNKELEEYRQFYDVFSNDKGSISWTKLCWSHYREVLSLKDVNAIKYYLNECENKNLTIKQLQEKIKSDEYGRLSEEIKDKLILSEQLMITVLVSNPIIIRVDMLNVSLNEYALKQAILNNLDEFLFQLGYGFTYVGNEYKIKFGDRYNYIDLLLFNYVYNSFVVVELKVTELKAEYIGQIKKYMNYIDKNIKSINQDETIGIIICKKDNYFVMEHCSDERIYRTTYELVNI